MAKFEHGKMDIQVQEKTFAGFVKAVTWGSVLVMLFLVFLAMVNG
jgi:hypothetical protein